MRLSASSVVLIGPDHRRRLALADMLAQLSVRVKAELSYYPDASEAANLTAEDCDAVLVDIEGNMDTALSLIEEIGRNNPTVTAMAYARRDQPELLLRCMESGARTLLQEPISMDALTSAMARASARRIPAAEPVKALGEESSVLVCEGVEPVPLPSRRTSPWLWRSLRDRRLRWWTCIWTWAT